MERYSDIPVEVVKGTSQRVRSILLELLDRLDKESENFTKAIPSEEWGERVEAARLEGEEVDQDWYRDQISGELDILEEILGDILYDDEDRLEILKALIVETEDDYPELGEAGRRLEEAWGTVLEIEPD